MVPLAEVFCTIMSTLIDLSARARKSRAATPGRSGTPLTVTLASEVSWVTAVTTASSMSASSSTTQVPGSQVKLLRTCSGTLWLRANSTARSIRTRPPVAAISSISSKEIRLMRCASGTRRGVGGEDPGDVGVDLADVGLEHGGQGHRGGVDPPRPRVVISRSIETPWNPATTGTLPSASASRRRSPLTSRILARVWSCR